MTTDLEWRELIDRSFGDGPDQPPIGDRLAAGRRAVRRRRIVASAAIVAFGVAAGGATWAAMPSVTERPLPAADLPAPQQDDSLPAETGDGPVTRPESGWQVAPEWTVVKRIPSPMGYELPKQSVAFELAKGPVHRFALATFDGDCCTYVMFGPRPEQTTLEAWAAKAAREDRL